MIFPKIKSFPIYWENGMKLSADHFQHLENSIEEAVRDARAASLLPLAGFGLLPNSPFDIQNAQGERPNSVKVILNACQAIMPGGFRVEILPENIQKYKLPAQAPYVEFVPSSGVRYHLYLTVSERERIPAGIPETRPIRHPYLVHDYQLECIPQDKLSAVRTLAANRMKIAEWQNGKRLEGYIPPCLTINGFPLLVRWYRYLQNQLENMVRIALQIINEHRKKHLPRAEFCIPIVQHIRGSQALQVAAPPASAHHAGRLLRGPGGFDRRITRNGGPRLCTQPTQERRNQQPPAVYPQPTQADRAAPGRAGRFDRADSKILRSHPADPTKFDQFPGAQAPNGRTQYIEWLRPPAKIYAE
ncbi:MAG: hypothetical protein AAF146_08410 [Bacteroidota bacterium]